MFPAFGFGAQVPPDWQVSTLFPYHTCVFHFRVMILGDAVHLLSGTQLYAWLQLYRHVYSKCLGLNTSFLMPGTYHDALFLSTTVIRGGRAHFHSCP